MKDAKIITGSAIIQDLAVAFGVGVHSVKKIVYKKRK
jgi:hypothetical protein